MWTPVLRETSKLNLVSTTTSEMFGPVIGDMCIRLYTYTYIYIFIYIAFTPHELAAPAGEIVSLEVQERERDRETAPVMTKVA